MQAILPLLPAQTTPPGERDISDTDELDFGFDRSREDQVKIAGMRQEAATADLQFLAEVIRGDWKIMSKHRFLRSRVNADGTGPWWVWASCRRRASAAALVRFMEVGTRENLLALVRAGRGFFVEDLVALRGTMRKLLRKEYLVRITSAIEELQTGRRSSLL